MYGDPNLCAPVENTSVNFHYVTSPIINQLRVPKYQHESSRYDETNYKMVSKFLETGEIKEKLAQIKFGYTNICFLKET